MGIADVVAPHRAEILRLAKSHKASRVRVFGSVARSAAGRKSDVDFLVEFSPSASGYDQVALTLDLESLLGRKVDVTTEPALHWLVRPQALLEAVAL